MSGLGVWCVLTQVILSLTCLSMANLFRILSSGAILVSYSPMRLSINLLDLPFCLYSFRRVSFLYMSKKIKNCTWFLSTSSQTTETNTSAHTSQATTKTLIVVVKCKSYVSIINPVFIYIYTYKIINSRFILYSYPTLTFWSWYSLSLHSSQFLLQNIPVPAWYCEHQASQHR